MNHLVLGIRAAKGLEFPDVLMLDFFSALPSRDQKPWKRLLSDDNVMVLTDSALQYPQLEGQLKLLYTGITRCCNRLVFAETRKSDAGVSFFRWLTRGTVDKKIAEDFAQVYGKKPTKAGDRSVEEETEDNMELMTNDEWRARGVDLAMLAEDAAETGAEAGAGAGYLTKSSSSVTQYLRKALQCFDRAGDVILKSRAETQMQANRLAERLQAMSVDTLDTADNLAPQIDSNTLSGQTSKVGNANKSSPMRNRCNILPIEEAEAAAVMARCFRSGLILEARVLSDALVDQLQDSGYYRPAIHNGILEIIKQ
jgi:hypothetical protein